MARKAVSIKEAVGSRCVKINLSLKEQSGGTGRIHDVGYIYLNPVYFALVAGDKTLIDNLTIGATTAADYDVETPANT